VSLGEKCGDALDRGLKFRIVARLQACCVRLAYLADQGFYPLSARRDRCHHRHTHESSQTLVIYVNAALAGFIQHVQVKDQGKAEFRELQGQEQSAAQVLRVGDLNNRRRPLHQEDVARHALILRQRRQPIDAGSIYDRQSVIPDGWKPLRNAL